MIATIPLCCPVCGEGIVADRDHCAGCGRRFALIRGILDLNVRQDAYMSDQEDLAIALKLDKAFDRLDFNGLLAYFFELQPEISPESRQRQIVHMESAPGRVSNWLDRLGELGKEATLLDLGCGSGSFAAIAAKQGRQVVGIDIAWRWLLIARKRLDESGYHSIPLVRCCSEFLPFRDESFDVVVGGDVIEHVGDARQTIAESYRVLKPGGTLFLATPNRYSLGAEPHVGVWGVGFLPRKWMTSYVRLASGRDFRAIRCRGIRAWTRILAESPFQGGTVEAPRLPRSDLMRFGPVKRMLGLFYNRVIASAFGRRFATRFAPLFHLIAARPIASPTLQIAKSASVIGKAFAKDRQTLRTGATVMSNRPS